MQERLQITLGARRQQVKSATFSGASGAQLGARYSQSATTPSVAILYKAGSRISLYANYAEGLSQGAIAPATAANAGQAFPPFKTRQKEAGLKLDLGEFAHTFSVFEIRRPGSYTDLLTNFFSFGGMQRNRGVEWGFFGQARPGLRLMGGLARRAGPDAHGPCRRRIAAIPQRGQRAVHPRPRRHRPGRALRHARGGPPAHPARHAGQRSQPRLLDQALLRQPGHGRAAHTAAFGNDGFLNRTECSRSFSSSIHSMRSWWNVRRLAF